MFGKKKELGHQRDPQEASSASTGLAFEELACLVGFEDSFASSLASGPGTPRHIGDGRLRRKLASRATEHDEETALLCHQTVAHGARPLAPRMKSGQVKKGDQPTHVQPVAHQVLAYNVGGAFQTTLPRR